jgi:hypothetical protein
MTKGTIAADDDFESLSWHDNLLHGLRWEIGDPERDQWHSRLILDIDHILEWLCGLDNRPQFKIAPATLTFEDATDLAVHIPQVDAGAQVALQVPSIHEIARERVKDQKICLDRSYWRWTIRLNQPQGGVIVLGASGLRMALRAEPALCEEQWYPTDRPRPLPF